MAANTEIEWADDTFNPWWGCQRVSPGCDHCYAEALDHRLGGKHWGPSTPYKTFGPKHWLMPYQWNARAQREGKRRRVFCASMADVFDLHAPEAEREKLWQVIDECRALDWLLLTKRPQNFERFLPWTRYLGFEPWPHVWLGVSAENQEEADRRIPYLLETAAAVRFVSYEPALGPVDFTSWIKRIDHCGACGEMHDAQEPDRCTSCGAEGTLASTWGDVQRETYRAGTRNDEPLVQGTTDGPPLSWIIAGSESGPGARPMDEAWVRSVRDQCAAAGVPLFYKQRLEAGRKVSLPVLDGYQHAEWPR